MLELPERSYPNVSFESPVYSFDQLCETKFLTAVFTHLQRSMGSAFEDYRFTVFSGPDSNDVVAHGDPAKMIVIHISDESSSIPYSLCSRVLAVFKSYLPTEDLAPNLYSFPLGYVSSTPNRPVIALAERRSNVFFSGNLNWNREEMFRVMATPSFMPRLLPLKLLKFLNPSGNCDQFIPDSYIRFTKGFRMGLDGEAYATHLADAKIVLCPRGFRSYETFRHFEAMRAGAIVLSERLPPLRLYKNSPIVMIDTWREARNRVATLLDSSQALAERQAATLEWWRNVCSEQATADYIAGIVLS